MSAPVKHYLHSSQGGVDNYLCKESHLTGQKPTSKSILEVTCKKCRKQYYASLKQLAMPPNLPRTPLPKPERNTE